MGGRVGTLVMNGVEFVVIAAAEYSSCGSANEGGSVPSAAETWRSQNDALDTPESNGRPPPTEAKQRQSRLRKARMEARLTQAQLATRLGKSQAFVSKSEAGRAQVGERYVRAVLAACEPPADFGAPEAIGSCEKSTCGGRTPTWLGE